MKSFKNFNEAVKGQDTESRKEGAKERAADKKSGKIRKNTLDPKDYATQQKKSIEWHDKRTKGRYTPGQVSDVHEVAPPGWGHTKAEKEKTDPSKPKSKVGGSSAAFKRALDDGRFKGLPGDKTKKDKVASMFKLMWSMKKKGAKPHYKPGTDEKYEKYKDKDEKNESVGFTIDSGEHKKASKKAKIRNLAKGNTNPNEKAAAEKKAGGPKLIGEEECKCEDCGQDPCIECGESHHDIKESISTSDAKRLEKATVLSFSNKPKDVDRARARQVEVDYKDLMKQQAAKKKKKSMKEQITLPLNIEIPKNSTEFNLGLMFRESLDENSGMLFKFDEVSQQSFHMKDTKIPLDIAFIKEDGTIESIKELNPYTLKPVYSEGEILYALEVNRGWFMENNIKVGDKVVTKEEDLTEEPYRGEGTGRKENIRPNPIGIDDREKAKDTVKKVARGVGKVAGHVVRKAKSERDAVVGAGKAIKKKGTQFKTGLADRIRKGVKKGAQAVGRVGAEVKKGYEAGLKNEAKITPMQDNNLFGNAYAGSKRQKKKAIDAIPDKKSEEYNRNWKHKTPDNPRESVELLGADGKVAHEIVDIIKPEPMKVPDSPVKWKELTEKVKLPAVNVSIIDVYLTWRGRGISLKLFFPQSRTRKPTREEVNSQIQKVYPGAKVGNFVESDPEPGEPFLQVGD
jgi:uncharacterized membrane protein (UPF0127 family)